MKRRRYACNAANGGCGEVGIAAGGLEELVLSTLAQEGRRPRPRGAGSVSILEARIDELADAFAAGEISRTEWVRARTEIANRLDAARRQLALPPGVDVEALTEQPFRVQRAYIATRVSSIQVSLRQGGNRFDPSRVSIRTRP